MADSPLEQQILEYLIKQPEAKDTLEGITGWWLPGTQLRTRREEVEKVLQDLVQRGWLTVTESASLAVYGLAQNRLADIKAYLLNRNGKA